MSARPRYQRSHLERISIRISVNDGMHEIPDPRPNPEEELLLSEEPAEELASHPPVNLALMTARQAVASMLWLDGLSHAEIGRWLGRYVGPRSECPAVCKLVRKGMARVRRLAQG